MPTQDEIDAGVPDAPWKTRLEETSRALLDTINELGDGFAPTLARQNIEIAVRVARDFADNPPKTVTAASRTALTD